MTAFAKLKIHFGGRPVWIIHASCMFALVSAILVSHVLCGCSRGGNEPPPQEAGGNTADREAAAISADPSLVPDRVAPCDGKKSVVVIQGIFDPTGKELTELGPVRLRPESWAMETNSGDGHFIAEVTGVNGRVTSVPFDALIADDSNPGVVRHGFFTVVVSVCGEVATIRITDATGETVFGQMNGSDILPES